MTMITGLHSLSCITVQSGKTAQDLAQQEDMLTLLKEKSSAEPSKLVRILINAQYQVELQVYSLLSGSVPSQDV